MKLRISLKRLVAHGANTVDCHVAAVARGEHMGALRGTEQALPMHELRQRDARNLERRGGDVERDHRIAAHRARFDVPGPAHHQRNMRARVVQPLLTA
jgi:hypothetical protein